MPTATQPRRSKNAPRISDQLRAHSEEQARQRDNEFSELIALILKDGVTAKNVAHIRDTLQRTGRSDEDLQTAVDRLEKRKSLFARMTNITRDQVKAAADQIAELEAEKEKAIKAIDEKIAPIRTELNRLVREHGRGEDAAAALVSGAEDWLCEEIDAERSNIQKRERQCSCNMRPVMGEDLVRWDHVDRKWEPLVLGDARCEESAHDFNRRLDEHREIAESHKPALEAAKARLAKLLDLAKQPWPTRADLAAIDGK